MTVRTASVVCPFCSYELRGLPGHSACPECGRPFPSMRQRWISDFTPTLQHLLFTIVAAALAAAKLLLVAYRPAASLLPGGRDDLARALFTFNVGLGVLVALALLWMVFSNVERGRGWLLLHIIALVVFCIVTSTHVAL